VALIGLAAGAIGSVGLMLLAGRAAHRNPPRFLLVLFAIWVLAPFMALAAADVVSKRWSAFTRATLHGLAVVLTLAPLAIYGHAVLRPPRSTPAFVFVAVPLGSWLLMAMVVPTAALISRRLSHRGTGA